MKTTIGRFSWDVHVPGSAEAEELAALEMMAAARDAYYCHANATYDRTWGMMQGIWEKASAQLGIAEKRQ